jgi:hypothetical protein
MEGKKITQLPGSVTYSKEKQVKSRLLQPRGLAKDGTTARTSGLTSELTGWPAALPLFTRGSSGESPVQPAPAAAPRQSWGRRAEPGRRLGKEAAGGGTPAPRAASPLTKGERFQGTSSNAPGPGSSNGLPGEGESLAVCPNVMLGLRPPPHPQTHSGSPTRLFSPRLPFRSSVSSLPPDP